MTVTGPDTVWLTAVSGLTAVPLMSAALILYPLFADTVTLSTSKWLTVAPLDSVSVPRFTVTTAFPSAFTVSV